jgi:hypothetical protein
MPPIPEKPAGAEGGQTFRGNQPPDPAGPPPSNDDVEEHGYDVTAVGPIRIHPSHGPSKGMGGLLGTDQ